jgi:pSer/pThr/pTyr-binding forkhead associated (FHA) protein/tetratricopeptide (TPR) repeat protein
MAQLDVVGPDNARVQVSLDGPELIIGRDPLAQLRLKGAKISRRHARLYWVQGTLWLEDLNSANGVSVNGARIGGPVPLPDDAEIRIGEYTLSLSGPSPAAVARNAAHNAEPVMVWVGQNPPVQGVRIAMTQGAFDVGRSDAFLVHINDNSVSRQHARGTVDAERLILHDADSRNGTFINEERIEDREVAIGDSIRFGNVRFVAEAPSARTAQPTPRRQAAPQPEHAPRPLVPQPEYEAPPDKPGSYRRAQLPGLQADSPAPEGAAAWPWAKGALALGIAGVLAIGTLAFRHGLDRRDQHKYESEMSQGLTLGNNQLQLGAWTKAIAAYQEVLRRDPLNEAAHRGRRQAELHIDVEQALAQLPEAESPLYLSTLFIRLAPLLADPEAASLEKKSKQQFAAAQIALAGICAGHAETACRSKVWPRCRDQAVCAVVFDPDNMLGAALLDQSLEQVPSPPLGHGPPADAVKRHASLVQRYPQANVRAAVLAYSTGDLPESIKALRQRRGGSDAQAALSTLWSLDRAQKAGEAALARGNSALAIRSFEEAVALDARLLPPGQPSVVGRALLERACGQWLHEGEQAFNRGRYPEALAAWQRGLQLDPNHRGLLRAVDKLEARAKQMFNAVVHATRLTEASCRQLRDILSMVRREQPLYQATQDKMTACPNHAP